MAAGYVVALDVGSSSVRAMLHDLRANPVRGAEVHLPHTPRVRPDGTAEAGFIQVPTDGTPSGPVCHLLA